MLKAVGHGEWAKEEVDCQLDMNITQREGSISRRKTRLAGSIFRLDQYLTAVTVAPEVILI